MLQILIPYLRDNKLILTISLHNKILIFLTKLIWIKFNQEELLKHLLRLIKISILIKFDKIINSQ